MIVPTGCAVWQDDLYFGAYGTGLLYRLSLPAAADAHADVVGDLGAGVTDLQVGPDGDLYVATSDAIWKLVGNGLTGTHVIADHRAARRCVGRRVEDGRSPSWRDWRSSRASSRGSSPGWRLRRETHGR